jgi:FkbM family methyltransferase
MLSILKFIYFWLFWIKKEFLFNFEFKWKKISMEIQAARTDIAMITEIFCFQVYAINHKNLIEPKLIIDWWANKWSTAIFFSILYPNAEVHCYEPNAKIFQTLEKNLKINKVNYILFNKWLSDINWSVFFEISQNHQYSSISQNQNWNKIDVVKIDDQYKNRKIDILKLDVEWEEEKIICSLSNETDIGIITAEIHYDKVVFTNIKDKIINLWYEICDPTYNHLLLNSSDPYPILTCVKI